MLGLLTRREEGGIFLGCGCRGSLGCGGVESWLWSWRFEDIGLESSVPCPRNRLVSWHLSQASFFISVIGGGGGAMIHSRVRSRKTDTSKPSLVCESILVSGCSATHLV